MNWISLLGMVTLLGLAWAISYHRKKVDVRPIAWGMGLQFLFAIIILRQDALSFAGLAGLCILLVNYVLREQVDEERPKWRVHGLYSLGALAVGAALYFAAAVLPMGWIAFGLAVLLALNAYLIKRPEWQPWCTVLMLLAATAYLIAGQITGKSLFDQASAAIADFLKLSDYGAMFLFGNLVDESWFFKSSDSFPGFGFQFAFKVLPTIIFFGGFMSVLYYLGIIQKVIETMARFMRWTIGTSGAETLSCSSNVFVGQTEAPLLIKPFLDKMTQSELLTIMVGGFATIAGGVLAGYINMGVDAGHLIAASVMSAPAALVIGKIIMPETEHSETAGDVALPDISVGDNLLEAASNGISDGLKLALNVGAMLVGFIALIAFLDVLLSWMDGWVDHRLLAGEYREYAITGLSPVTGEYMGIFPGSLQTLFGTLLSPLAFLMGVPWEDAAAVGNLLGVKLSLNEFVAFGSLGSYIQGGVISPRAQIIATYALCGFANFSSIGIQIGGISALAPERRGELAKLALKAMFGGAFASWTTATVAGILL